MAGINKAPGTGPVDRPAKASPLLGADSCARGRRAGQDSGAPQNQNIATRKKNVLCKLLLGFMLARYFNCRRVLGALGHYRAGPTDTGRGACGGRGWEAEGEASEIGNRSAC